MKLKTSEIQGIATIAIIFVLALMIGLMAKPIINFIVDNRFVLAMGFSTIVGIIFLASIAGRREK